MEGSNFPQQFAVWGAEKKAQMCRTEQTVQATRQESQSYWYATVAHKYMESEGELLNAWWEDPQQTEPVAPKPRDASGSPDPLD